MEQVTNLESNEAKQQRPGRRFGNHLPNRYSVNPAENPVFNQFSNIAGLDISLGASISFYTNKLDHNQFSQLLETLPDINAKRQFSKPQNRNKPLNWLYAISFASQGKKPCVPLSDSIDTYNGFDIDKDGKRIITFGYTDLTFDFSKLPLCKAEDGAPAYPYGIMFFSDIYNDYDNYNAVISCIPDRKNDVSRCNFIKPVDFDHRGPIHCSGKFKMNGNYIIFYVSNEIEKQKNVFLPDVTIINIPVTVFRDHKQGYIIKETDVCSIKKRSTCVSNFIDHIIDILKFYGVNNVQFIGETIHAFGYDPLEYNYPPSLGDERSYYYGGNKVHMGGKENNMRHNKPFMRNNSIFNYLDEVNKKNNAKIVLPAPSDITPPETKTKRKEEYNRKEDTVELPETEQEQEQVIEAEYPQVEEPDAEIPQNVNSEDEATEEEPNNLFPQDIQEEAEPAEEPNENAQSNEESPQSENIAVEEVVENGSN